MNHLTKSSALGLALATLTTCFSHADMGAKHALCDTASIEVNGECTAINDLVPGSDEAAVYEVMATYGLGTKTRDTDLVQSTFDEGALMSGWLGPNELVGSPQPFLDFLAANEVSPEYRDYIVRLDVNDSIASVETYEENLFGMKFENQFHLLRDGEGQWRITSKLFVHF